MAGMAGF